MAFLTAISSPCRAAADQFPKLVETAPIIVAAKIIEVTRDPSASTDARELTIRAEVGAVAKGEIKLKEKINVVIRLEAKEFMTLETHPFGLKPGNNLILFIRPQVSSGGKQLIHYRFTEIPLGCLQEDVYTWKKIKSEVEKS